MKDITGQKFSRLTVARFDHKSENNHYFWLCKCDCGNETIVDRCGLVSGNTKSCGCLKREKAKPPLIVKHGMSNTRLYQIWKDMKGRCERETSQRYHTHGERGVRLCDEWHNFVAFKKWAVANGYRDDLTIDRINNNGDYCPENCRWATQKEQANNRRTNRFVEYNGETHTLAEWARLLSINYYTLCGRIKRGWSAERAFTKK